MSRLTAPAPPVVSRAVLRRRTLTAISLMVFGREHVARGRHEPLPDAGYPGHCDVCGHELDAELHQRRFRRRRGPQAPVGDPLQKAGWR
jgi:hypothetical protein